MVSSLVRTAFVAACSGLLVACGGGDDDAARLPADIRHVSGDALIDARLFDSFRVLNGETLISPINLNENLIGPTAWAWTWRASTSRPTAAARRTASRAPARRLDFWPR